jgi:hypothetical protein
MKKHFTLLFLITFSTLVGQITFQPKQIDYEFKGIIYNKETAFDFTLHNNGASIGMNFGKIGPYQSTKYYHYEIGFLKDPREKNQNKNLALSLNEVSSSFKYGKQNNAIFLRGGIGVKKFLSDKAKRKGIAIGYNYEIGPSLAVLIPYYLDLIYVETENGQINYFLKSEKYTEENAEKFLDYDAIYGSSGYFSGLSSTKIYPGIQAKLGLLFSFGLYDKTIKSLEIGIMGDAFIQKIPIMVQTDLIKNKPYFLNFYLTFQFGKRNI